MSLPGKLNRNTAKRIYNINSLNNPTLMDLFNTQQFKNSPQFNTNNNKNNQINNPILDQKYSPLTITAKSLISHNFIHKTNNTRSSTKNTTQLQKNIKEMKLILEQPSENMIIHKNQKEKIVPSLHSTKSTSQKKYNSQKFLSETQLNTQKYYQNVIINDPTIYNQAISVYKQFQKAININDKNQISSHKRISFNKGQNKIIQKNKLLPRSSQHDSKNDQQRKKINQFNLYRQFQFILNLSNQVILIPQPEIQYKAFIGKGNNGLLIKSILKTRPWWCIRTSQDLENCNVIWTQWKRPKYMKYLADGEKYVKKTNQSQKSQSGFQVIPKNKKFNQLAKILTNQKIKKYSVNIDLISSEQITKMCKKMSDPNFNILVSKRFTDVQKKNSSKNNKAVNHIPGCFQLHSKKLLYANMKRYYEKKNMNVCDYLPQTYVISKGLDDPAYEQFLQAFNQYQKLKAQKNTKNIWICKPGQNSNRGNGITVVSTLNQIKNFITSHSSSNGLCSALIQKYMENPFLYNKRKFDIRCYILITSVNGIIKGYWYEQGYIRTTSKQFTLRNIENKFIHLTNDAIQKKGDNYGKFQSCNKVSYQQFQKYLQQNHKQSNFNFKNTLDRMKQQATDLINSVGNRLNSQTKQYSFELFGLDFMLDDKLQPFIIQANSNPCIQVSGNVLGRIIPSMLENVIRIAIDPIFPPPYSQNPKTTKYSPGNAYQQNKFVLIYDSLDHINNIAEQNLELTKQEEEQERLFNAQIQQENEEN